jgi:hypothetical protein
MEPHNDIDPITMKILREDYWLSHRLISHIVRGHCRGFVAYRMQPAVQISYQPQPPGCALKFRGE